MPMVFQGGRGEGSGGVREYLLGSRLSGAARKVGETKDR